MFNTPRFEGVLGSVLPLEVNTTALSWVECYFQLKPEVKDICDIAIERLNLVRRRRVSGDKAIEGAICLEALLGDDDNRELLYKLRLRAALLLSTEIEERRKISKTVKKFYDLRSKVVHSTRSTKAKEDTDALVCAKDGLDICTRALQRIVELNEKFIPADWELSGGKV